MHEDSVSPGGEASHNEPSHQQPHNPQITHQEYEQHDLNSHLHPHEDPEDHHKQQHPKHHQPSPSSDTTILLPPSYGTVNYYHPLPELHRAHRSTGGSSPSVSLFKALFILLWFGMFAFILVQTWKGYFCPWENKSVWDIGCGLVDPGAPDVRDPGVGGPDLGNGRI